MTLSTNALLFRRISAQMVDGDEVLGEAAIDLPRTSCNCDCHSEAAEDVLELGKYPDLNGVAAVRVGDLPDEIRNDVSHYDCYACHCPEKGNHAHCEIRVKRHDREEDWHKPGSRTLKSEMRSEIAKCMMIVLPPTDLHDDEF